MIVGAVMNPLSFVISLVFVGTAIFIVVSVLLFAVKVPTDVLFFCIVKVALPISVVFAFSFNADARLVLSVGCPAILENVTSRCAFCCKFQFV